MFGQVMPEMCADCPFGSSKSQRNMRNSLRPGRFNEIAQSVWMGASFPCHKTTTFDDDDEYAPTGREKECRGAIEFVSPIAYLPIKGDTPVNYSALDPSDHAASLIETCHGDAHEALALAYTNIEFSHEEETRHYWDRIAIAIQQRIDVKAVPAVFVGDHGEILRVMHAVNPEEMETSNRLLRAIGCDRRWMLL